MSKFESLTMSVPSSAKKVDSTFERRSGKSLMYIIKKRRPRIEPYPISSLTGKGFEIAPLNLTI